MYTMTWIQILRSIPKWSVRLYCWFVNGLIFYSFFLPVFHHFSAILCWYFYCYFSCILFIKQRNNECAYDLRWAFLALTHPLSIYNQKQMSNVYINWRVLFRESFSCFQFFFSFLCFLLSCLLYCIWSAFIIYSVYVYNKCIYMQGHCKTM